MIDVRRTFLLITATGALAVGCQAKDAPDRKPETQPETQQTQPVENDVEPPGREGGEAK